MQNETTTIFRPQLNCWRVETAGRAAFLIDACRYFAVVDEALALAQRRITIVGWDMDSDVRLVPEGPTLSDRLVGLLDANPDLEIQVLIWRSSLVYAHNRDFPHPLGRNWWDHPRIDYRLDAQHPIGGSHHQKLVCIDDGLAFVGGIDLTNERWDACGHLAQRAERVSTRGESYGPVHDVQMAVDGDAAAAIAELARERWFAATGEVIQPLPNPTPVWPRSLRPDLRRHPVAIARTRAEYEGQTPAREIERLNLDCLEQAERSIYIEAQYFALPAVAERLAAHLERAEGPEVVLVVNYNSHGKLEQYVMGQNRDRLFGYLRAADRHGRLGLFFSRAACDPPCDVKIHSKVVIVDDAFLRIGSSNLNQRSIGVDSECDLAVEGGTEAARKAIRRFRRDLLADHLRVSPRQVAAVLRASGDSLLRTVARLADRGCLMPYAVDASEAAPPVMGTSLLDPAEPFTLQSVIGAFKT